MTPKKILFKKKNEIQSTVVFIAEQIENVIIENGLKPGDKLPTSRELQELMGTSQGSLREAIRILEQKGLIDIRIGRNGGLFVKAIDARQINQSVSLLIRQKRISLDHLFVFRSTLEVAAASLAAMESKKEDIQELKALLVEANECLKKGVKGINRFHALEAQMHRTLARMTNNPLYELVLITVFQNCIEYNYRFVPSKTKDMQESYEDWYLLIEAMENCRADKAGWIMTRHLQRYLPSPEQGFEMEIKLKESLEQN